MSVKEKTRQLEKSGYRNVVPVVKDIIQVYAALEILLVWTGLKSTPTQK